jgi:hypothetical protein
MKMDLHNGKELVAEIVLKLDDVNTELKACELSFLALKSQCSELEKPLGVAAGSSAQLQRAAHEKYEIPTERFVERFDEAASDCFFLTTASSVKRIGPSKLS